ncbi:MAG: hypothetical protein SGI90_14355 [Candidatus Eisenbacteria bacterium]|nr:hypothetical protein [Candidatus Eisenbacteria bacterium]
MILHRRRFLEMSAAGLWAVPTLLSGSGAAMAQPADGPLPLSPGFPSHDPDLARGMVGASHGNVARVRELLAISGALSKASWDWGFGDWETALGAASHTGNREIAALLMENGARPDIFTLTRRQQGS